VREDAFIKEGWMHVATEYHGDVRDRLHLCATVHGCDAKKTVWEKAYFHIRGEMSWTPILVALHLEPAWPAEATQPLARARCS
jgi:hypothetical protein